ncbi:MAG: M1 family metallopeptidase [Pyrinomonadaceae bacterium]
MSIFRRRAIFRDALAAVFFVAASISVGAQRPERLITTWQPTQFDITLTFERGLSQIAAAKADVLVRIDQNDVSMVDFDFGTLTVSSVTLDGKPARFLQHDGKLDVYLVRPAARGQKFKITVEYSGKPVDGLILTNDMDGLPSAIGDNWPDRVHNWIPCLDHPSAKAPVRFTVTAPAENVVTANGSLVSTADGPNGTKTWAYDEAKPISPYNMVVAIGQFATGTLQGPSPVPVSYYVPRSKGLYGEKAFAPAITALDTYTRLISDPYPYKKLALIVGATRYGGMENANTIVLMPTFFDNFLAAAGRSSRFDIPTNREELEAHEVAHQWFGDSVTESTWADLWLSEGFATYFAGLFVEENEGEIAFHTYMEEKEKAYLAYEKHTKTPIHDTDTISLFALLNPNNYEKGAYVLHTLRGMLGDREFRTGIALYYKAHKDGLATTDDLRKAFEKASGRDLKGFFDRWVYKSGHPIYQISWTDAGGGKIRLTLNQKQEDEAFLQPVTVGITTKTGSHLYTITPTGKESEMTITSSAPQQITIDPSDFILKEVVQ